MFGGTEYDATCMHAAADFANQLASMQRAMREGKILSWGLSNETPWGICRAIEVAHVMGLPGPSMVQNAYNLLCRIADIGVAEVCAMERVPFIGYSPLAMGLLGGEYEVGKDGRWRGAAYKRLVRYRHKYAEAESRCGGVRLNVNSIRDPFGLSCGLLPGY
jgi:aryl-alcohol dehydrogenase-like predicted oxidoreductase